MALADANNNNDQLAAESEFVLEAISVNSSKISGNANHVPTVERADPFKHSFYQKIRRYLWAFPLLVSIFLPALTFGSYIYAVHSKQMKPILPFISDAIGVAPQAGLANTMFDIVTILIVASGYIRYKQLKYYFTYKTTSTVPSIAKCPPLKPDQINRLHHYNFISILCLYISAFGMFIIANCRAPENPSLHFLGVIIFVHGISAYFLLLVHLTKKLYTVCGIESNPLTMTIVCIVSVILLFTMVVLTIASSLVAGVDNFANNQWRFNWAPDNPGYHLHVICTFVEWIGVVACGSILYFCLFRRIKNFTEWHKVQF